MMLTMAVNAVMNLEVYNVTEKNSACREGSRRHAPCKIKQGACRRGVGCSALFLLAIGGQFDVGSLDV